MLVCVALGALFANGATGPLAALMTLILPPEIKSFGLSVFEFVSFLLGPMYSVVMGVGLQVRLLASSNPNLHNVQVHAAGYPYMCLQISTHDHLPRSEALQTLTVWC